MQHLLIFTLYLISDPCCSEPNTVTGYLGETVTINCSYPDQHERDIKIFYRQDGQRLTPVISTTETQRDRFSISDNRGSRVLSVRIRDVREGDGGVYYCGVQDGIWDLSYYSLYTETHLQVTDCVTTEKSTTENPSAPHHPGSSVITIFIISVCVCVVLLLIGGSALVSYRLRTQGSLYVHAQTRTPNTADGDYENDPGHRNISIGPLHQSLDPNTNQSESAYQTLNPNTNQSESAYQSLNPNQSDSLYQSLHPNTNQSDSVYQNFKTK